MSNAPNLGTSQMDALREVASIGAGHAATALSQMTQQRIMITVPEITVSGADGASHPVAGLEDPKEIAAAVSMRMLGDLTGHTMFVIPKQNAKLLCDMLLRRELGATATFDELETSSLKEAGNIVGGAMGPSVIAAAVDSSQKSGFPFSTDAQLVQM